jgi:magnesium chelatase family protein
VHISSGLPGFSIVGLPEGAVRESKDRVRSAIMTSKFKFPKGRITVSLAPANLPKSGGRYDLPIAIGLLIASEQIKPNIDINSFEFYVHALPLQVVQRWKIQVNHLKYALQW